MAGEVRTGRISAVDYAGGRVRVTYRDRGKSVTGWVNVISNGVYRMPRIGQMVSVIHNSNGATAAVMVGTLWNETDRPVEGREGLYRRELCEEPGKAFERYDTEKEGYTLSVNGTVITVDRDGNLDIDCPRSITVRARNVTLVGDRSSISV